MESKFVRIEITDSYGLSRGLLLSRKYFDSHINKGIAIVLPGVLSLPPYNEIVEGTGFQGEIGYPDAYFYPDRSTMLGVPSNPKISSVIGDLRIEANNPDSAVSTISSRGILQNALQKLKNMGFKFYGAFEFEFYLYVKNDGDNYALVSNRKDLLITSRQFLYEKLVTEIMECLEKAGMQTEAFHFELGESQTEITYGPVYGVKVADNAMRFKQIVKEVCDNRGYYASFMSKPVENVDVSSSHLNHSLWDMNNKNVLFDSNNTNNLSELSRHWLGGLQEHFKSLACLVAPNVNCYERLAEGFGTMYNTWGIDNRATNFRFKNADQNRTYLELRQSGAGTNPYLTMAAIIYAGIDGIIRKIEPKQASPMKGYVCEQASNVSNPQSEICNLERIPDTFEDAIVALNNDTYMCSELGEDFIKCFNVLRQDEIKRYREEELNQRKTEWLKKQYFTCF